MLPGHRTVIVVSSMHGDARVIASHVPPAGIGSSLQLSIGARSQSGAHGVIAFGIGVGEAVGVAVGVSVGKFVGAIDGPYVGPEDGAAVGATVGSVGAKVKFVFSVVVVVVVLVVDVVEVVVVFENGSKSGRLDVEGHK